MRAFTRSLSVTLLGASLVIAARAGDAASYGDRIDAALAEAAESVGGDPGKALAWVETATDFEAYRGALRGARGAFVAGRANSVDQALLLQAVLKPETSRFASCTLSEADASALAEAQAAALPVLAVEKAGALSGEAGDAKAKDYLTKLAAAWAALTATQSAESAALAEAVTKAGIVFAGPDTALLRRDAAAAHVWLQTKTGEDWLDLDATIAGAKPGQARCAADQTFETLPDELRHRASVAVIVEVMSESGLERHELLRQDSDVAAIAFDDALLFFAEAQGIRTAADAEAVKTGAFAYTPVLRIGAADTTGEAFLAAAPKSGFGAAGETGASKVGGASDVIGGLGEPEAPPAAPASKLPEEPVAVFIEITLSSPGQAPETVTATIFDRLGAAARAAGRKLAALKDLAETDGDYVELARVWTIGVLTGVPVQRLEQDPKALVDGDIFVQAQALAGSVRGFETIEGALLRGAGLSPLKTHLRPRVLLLGFGPSGQGEAAKISFTADLAASAVEDAPDARETVAQRAARAVARVLAERIVAGAGGLPVPASNPGIATETASDLVALSAAARVQGLALAATAPAFEDPDANRLAGAHLAAGRVILAPPTSVDLNGQRAQGWWVADTQAGLLYDELGDGRSAESVEYTESGEPARQSAPAWHRHACAIRRAVTFAAFALSFALGSPELASAADAAREGEEIIELAEERAREEAAREGGGAGC